MNSVQELGQVTKYHRKRAGLSQHALAKLAGVGKTAVFDLEKGKETVQLDTVKKILNALNIRMVLASPLMKEYEQEGRNEKG